MKSYTQLTQEQRYQIWVLKRMGHCRSEIARAIEVHRSTIGRELGRNTGGGGYRAKQAHEKALGRRAKSKPRIAGTTWRVVEEKLREDWSPEQVAGWMKHRCGLQISHERIYQYILADKQAGGELYTHLRCQKKRRKRYGKQEYRGTLPNRVGIEACPALVEQRERLGDWEVDTLVGKGRWGALVSLVERESRFTLMQWVDQRLAELVSQAMILLLDPLASLVHTITADNGKEFAKHVQIAEALQATFYFAHPYAAWERGTNENTNGLIRQYFPKKTDFSQLAPEQVLAVTNKLNQRPRKCLDYYSPAEVFSVALKS